MKLTQKRRIVLKSTLIATASGICYSEPETIKALQALGYLDSSDKITKAGCDQVIKYIAEQSSPYTLWLVTRDMQLAVERIKALGFAD